MKPVTVTTTDASGGTKNSSPIVVDHYGWPEISLNTIVTGTATYTVQQTFGDPFGTASLVWASCPDPNFVGATTSQIGQYTLLPTAIRLQQTAGSGSVTLTIIQVGPLV